MKDRAILQFLSACIVIAIVFTSAVAAAADGGAEKAGAQVLLKQHCYRCHGADTQEGDLALHKLSVKIAAGESLDRWTKIAERLKAGDMPPADEPQPDPQTIDRVVKWIEGELVAAGKSNAIRAGSLQTGNQVDHDLLFNADIDVPLYAPARVWRLNNEIYKKQADDATDRALTRTDAGRRVSDPFSVPPGDVFRYQASVGLMDESTASQLIRNGEQLVQEQTRQAVDQDKRARKTPKEFFPLLQEKPPATEDQIKAAITKQFQIWLKRPPTEDEMADHVDLHRRNLETGGAVVGTRTTLLAVLLHPESIYRFELGEPVVGDSQLKKLTPRETAFALSYSLTDSPPAEQLLRLADEGGLSTANGVAAEVKRMLDDPKLQKPRILRFFREYFGYPAAADVFKETDDFPAFKIDGLIQDTDLLVQHILAQDKDVFRQLLTTNVSFTHYNGSDENKKKVEQEIAKHKANLKKDPKKYKDRAPKIENRVVYENYNLPDFVLKKDQPVRLPAKQRAGILTQPSWLVAYSGNFDNDPVKRGKWIRTRLLGGKVPDLPIGVDAQLPEEPHNTLRERMRVTRESYCWQCHRKMNPLGVTFENFDHFGRFRTHETVLDTEATAKNVDEKGRDLGDVMRDVAVNASGEVDYTGDASLDGKVENSIELLHRIAESARSRQVFVRHAFRYWMGREENLGDARTLRAADKAYVESGGSMNALIVSLMSSESFLYRTGADDSSSKSD